MARSRPTRHLKAPQCFNGVSQWLKYSYTPILQDNTPFYTVFGPAFTSKCSKFKREKNEIKMIKRDWKLPNPSYFTYTSIVQPVLQANNPFLQANSPFSQFLFQNWQIRSGKNSCKMVQNGSISPHRVFKGPPML